MSSAIANRLQKKFQGLKSYVANHKLQAYRIYDHDIPEYPYFIDLYGSYAVVWVRSDREKDSPEKLATQKKEIESALYDSFEVHRIFFKERQRQAGKSQYTTTEKSFCTKIREGELTFEVELAKYTDTGLFLDHRPLRKWLQNPRNGKLLNLFCYTGSLSVAAASAGMTTTSVDLSSTYISWAKRNFRINRLNVSEHHFVTQACEEYLRSCHQKFDEIILDPPTFSNSKKLAVEFDIQRDHSQMIDLCMNLLLPDGTLYFSTNKQKFQLKVSGYEVEDCTEGSIPKDFTNRRIHRLWKIRHQVTSRTNL